MDIFRKKAVLAGNDRYAMYRLVRKRVAFANPRRRTHVVEGVVENVSRDIFEDVIELELKGGRSYQFKEPTAMLKREGGVVLVYGDVRPENGTDEELFRMAEEKGWRENVHEVLKRTAPRRRSEVRIYVLPDEPKAKRRRRKSR